MLNVPFGASLLGFGCHCGWKIGLNTSC